MKKMNRRDYLKGMGAGAAGVIAASQTHLYGRSGGQTVMRRDDVVSTLRSPSSDAEEIAEATIAKSDWNWTDREPKENPGIRLIFVGMMAFTYKGKDAEVIFHRGSADHKLRIVIHEVTDQSCAEIFKLGGGIKPVQIDRMDLQINDKSSDATFFRLNANDFDRKYGHPRDFRWLLDLEGKDLYTKKLDRTEDIFRTKLKVHNGTFFTYQRTNATFKVEGGPKPGPIYHLAKVMAADVPLTTRDECATFTIDGSDVPLTLCGDARYEIYFFNDCLCGDNECSMCSGSDFSMVFDALSINPTDTFKVTLDESGGGDTQTTGLCLKIPPQIIKTRNTDDAPCMGAGFGAGGGFP